jgi:hypothetical protein
MNYVLTIWLFFACLPITVCAADSSGVSAETRAFARAQAAWLAFATTGQPSDVELIWHSSLRILSQSDDPMADEYLATLGLFSIDAAIGSDFTCAAIVRSPRLSRYLRERQRTFGDNYCSRLARDAGVPHTRLCASATTFKKRVASLQQLPAIDIDGACLRAASQ